MPIDSSSNKIFSNMGEVVGSRLPGVDVITNKRRQHLLSCHVKLIYIVSNDLCSTGAFRDSGAGAGAGLSNF